MSPGQPRTVGPPGRRWSARRSLLAEVGPAVGLAVVGLLTAPYVDRVSAADETLDPLGVGLIVVAGLATAARRRCPVPVLVVVALATAGYLTAGYPYGPIMFSVAVAVYAVARRRPPVPAAAWCLGALAVLLVHLFTNDAALPGLLGVFPASAWVAVPFSLGLARRLVVEAGARERRETERRLLDAERLRLAQEVHDIVGHGLAAIQMQADIALHLRRTKPAQALVALEAISRASADALAELRATLAAISPVGAGQRSGDRAPTPGLDRLDDLCERVRAAGVSVALAVHGRRRRLPPAVDVAAYRVLQESLTNVVKHSAHPAREHRHLLPAPGGGRDGGQPGRPGRARGGGVRHQRHAPAGGARGR
ncbi:sensor histidine kinase [Micromonospora thermarum]|uniref:histidine kinase n=1 Tax=Micromonospora thermarum TaxID=2720024 RepID=A0ABX0ZCU0_9ACTN|nr:histidine kinase [Micromonospora thermarum]NJP35049.1 sensor histidine kinase [Micromonospora thermarum]